MANEHAEPADQTGMDFAEHERTYKLFVRLLTISAAVVAGVLVLLALIAG